MPIASWSKRHGWIKRFSNSGNVVDEDGQGQEEEQTKVAHRFLC